jgi:hypothetical protein
MKVAGNGLEPQGDWKGLEPERDWGTVCLEGRRWQCRGGSMSGCARGSGGRHVWGEIGSGRGFAGQFVW